MSTDKNNGNQRPSGLANGTGLPAVPEHSPAPPAPPAVGITASQTSSEFLDLAARARVQRFGRKAQALLIGADYRTKDPVRHPDGGKVTAQEAYDEATAERVRIENDTRQGSRKHQRVAGWVRQVPMLVLAFDLLLLLYFFAGITDVNWASPLSASLGFAVLLAAMVTVLSYGFLSYTGHRMRACKDHSGAVPLEDLDALSKVTLIGALIVIAILATLMFTRMRTEVIYALGPGSGGTALVIALTLAAVSGAANLLVIGIHAHDGSDQVDRMHKLSAAANSRLAKAHRLRERAARHAAR
ncbi:MAG: hypothetical protein ACRDNW_01145 [Trebonia sp.]